MNVYDFDKTIYKYDSAKKFYFYLLKHKPILFWHLIVVGFWAICLGLHIIDLTKFKAQFFSIFKYFKDIDFMVNKFWEKQVIYVYPWYLQKLKKGDVICTASPEFLIKACMDKINSSAVVIGSKIDKFTGKYVDNSVNCKGKEKVKRLKQAGYSEFDNGYGDSDSDAPMLFMCKNRFRLKDGEIFAFEEEFFKEK